MFNSGLDFTKFKVHSIRSAASTKANLNFVSMDKIISVAGWSNTKTFATYYNKPVRKIMKTSVMQSCSYRYPYMVHSFCL